MTTLLDRLNLRPQERRLVVMAAAVLFLVLQFWLVWPHFKEWGQTKAAMDKAEKTLLTYRTVLAQTNEYRAKLEKLESQSNTGLLTPEQVGRRLAELARRHRPTSMGLALLQENLPVAIDGAAAALSAMRRELGTSPPGSGERR